MKKIVITGAVLSFLALTSCGKSYRCDCAHNDGTGDVVDTFNDDSNVKRKEKKATEQCQTNEDDLTFFYPNISCTLVNE